MSPCHVHGYEVTNSVPLNTRFKNIRQADWSTGTHPLFFVFVAPHLRQMAHTLGDMFEGLIATDEIRISILIVVDNCDISSLMLGVR